MLKTKRADSSPVGNQPVECPASRKNWTTSQKRNLLW